MMNYKMKFIFKKLGVFFFNVCYSTSGTVFIVICINCHFVINLSR